MLRHCCWKKTLAKIVIELLHLVVLQLLRGFRFVLQPSLIQVGPFLFYDLPAFKVLSHIKPSSLFLVSPWTHKLSLPAFFSLGKYCPSVKPCPCWAIEFSWSAKVSLHLSYCSSSQLKLTLEQLNCNSTHWNILWTILTLLLTAFLNLFWVVISWSNRASRSPVDY